jgi:phosphatidylglycerol:prolipoprotein diacylglycerol transferase
MAYGVVRFGLEFTRQPDAQLGFVLGPLSMGQLLCLAMILLGVAVAVSTGRRRGEPFVG